MSFMSCRKTAVAQCISLSLALGGVSVCAHSEDVTDLTALNSALSSGAVNQINITVDEIVLPAGSLDTPVGSKTITGLTDANGSAASIIKGLTHQPILQTSTPDKLTLENIIITSDAGSPVSVSGAAIYAQLDTHIDMINSEISNHHTSEAGAVFINHNYPASEALNMNIRDSAFRNNIADGTTVYGDYSGNYAAGGAIGGGPRATFKGDIDNALFYGNRIGNVDGQEYRGGAIGFINVTSNITNSRFENNSTGGSDGKGGAIFGDYMQVSIVDSQFVNNSSAYGGALYTTVFTDGQSKLNINGALFESNHASKDGGAIWTHATGPTVIDTSFINNTADEHGGALYGSGFWLRATQGGTTLFSGNMANGQANSIYSNDLGVLDVSTALGGVVDMRDPFELVYSNFTFRAVKTGDGEWRLGGNNLMIDNGFNQSKILDIQGGTLYLYGDGEVANPNLLDGTAMVEAGHIDASNLTMGTIAVATGATIAAGGDNVITAPSVQLKDNSTLRAGVADTTSLTLTTTSGNVDVTGTFNVNAANASQNFTVDALFAGSGAAVRKTGDGIVNLALSDAFAALDTVYVNGGKLNSTLSQSINRLETVQGSEVNITAEELSINSGIIRGIINAGSMEKNSAGDLDIYGKINVDGAFNMNQGNINFYIDMDSPTVTADTATFSNGTHLNVSGYSGSGRGDKAVLVRANNEVDLADMPLSYTLGHNAEPLDFINAEIRRSEDGKEIIAYIDLSWKSERYDGAAYSEAHGTFTLQDAHHYFELDSELDDRTENCSAWDGKTLTKKGLGTLALAGQNSYSGGSVVDDGTLLAKTDGAIGSGAATVNGSGTLALQYHGTFANDVIGAGTVESNGRITAVSDMSQHNGNFNVSSGSLGLGAVGQTIVSGAVFNIADAALLHGNGQIGGLSVKRGGTVAPGHSIGLINVQGNVDFEAGSFYDVEVDPNDQTVADRIHATGSADLGGATVRHIGMGAEDSYPKRGEWTILSADGGYGSTRFADDVGGNYLFLDQYLTYPNPNEVHLVIERNGRGLDEFELTPNQESTAEGIDDMDDDSELYEKIIALPEGSNMPDIYDQLSGELHPTLRGAVHTKDRDFARTMKGRMNYAGALGGYGAVDKFPAWIDLEGFTAKHTGGWGVADGKHSGFSVTIGAERQLNADWAAGGAFRYTRSEVKVSDRASKGDIDSFMLGGYAGTKYDKFNFAFGAAYGIHLVDTERHVSQQQIRQTLNANYKGHSAIAFVDAGYMAIENQNVVLEPYVTAGWNGIWMDSFQESGGFARLDSKAEHQSNATSQLGVRGKYVLPDNRFAFTGDAGWFHLFGSKKTRNHYRFIDGGNSRFTIRGIDLPTDAVVVNGGLNMKASQNSTVRVAYEGMFGDSIKAHQGNLTYMYSF